MGSFDSLETAARVRDIIKRGAQRQIQTEVGRPITGRVVTVDLVNLKAMVWFSSDDQPIQVNMLQATIPGSWSRRGFPSNVTNTATEGFGSIAVVQRYNGQLYITDVITGGQLAYNIDTVNATITELLPWDGTGDIVGENHRSLIAVRVSSDDSVNVGGAVMFGPFLLPGNDSPFTGNTQVTVASTTGTKRYNFDFVQYTLSNTIHSSYLNQWYRILPEGEGLYSTNDWDLDIAYRQTPHGLDRTFQSTEIWFRLVNRNAAAGAINHSVSIDSTLFTRPQGFDKQYTCEVTQSASDPIGYLGFHQPSLVNSPRSDWYCLDQFGRVSTTSLGVADTGETWVDDIAAQCGTDGEAAYLSMLGASQNIRKTITPNVNGASLVDIEAWTVVSVPATSAGGDVRASLVWRQTGSTTYYRASLIFATTGVINWEIIKRVAGTDTTVTSGTTAITYSANEKIGMQVFMIGTAISFKFWKYDTQDPNDVSFFTTTDAAISTTGALGIRATTAAGNTNTTPHNVKFYEFRAGNTGSAQVKENTADIEFRTGPFRSPRLRLGDTLQRTIFCTSAMTWDGSRLSWGTGQIRVGNAGRHRDGLREGQAFVSMPASSETIQIMPNGTSATVNSTGIPMSAGQSLWLGVPPGTLDRDLKNHLFIVDDSGGTNRSEMGIPEWAILIAAIPPTDSTRILTGFTDTGRMGCSLRRVANQSIPNAGGSDTAVAWDTEDADPQGMHSGSSATVTIPADGLWAIATTVTYGSVVGAARALLDIIVNGDATKTYRLPYAGTGEQIVSMGVTIPMVAGDTFTVTVYQSSGGANNLTGRLTCYRVGA
jgi:hypothetical protein